MFEQALIPVADPQSYDAVRASIESAFSSAGIEIFLTSLVKSSLRIRDFEAVLKAGKLGPETHAGYHKLGDGDQGQIRELYLASLERVPMELRDKYYKLYAYY